VARPDRAKVPAARGEAKKIARTTTSTVANRHGTGPRRQAGPSARILATGVYVTGSVGLAPGSRYGIAVDGPSLLILGPVDADPKAIAIERELAGIEAVCFEDRLLVNRLLGGRHRLALVFASIAGGAPWSVAEEIRVAAMGADPTTS
jgi:hypothetical protein